MSFTYSHGHQVPWDQYQTDIVKKNKEIAQLKEDARTNLDYSVKYEKDLVKKNEEIAELKAKMNLSPCLYAVQYEKDLVKKNEEIAELKAEIEKLKDEDKCVMDMLDPSIKEEVAKLKAENEKWGCWASDVLYYSHSASKDTLQAKNLITESNQPTFTKIRNFGEEIEKLKAENYKLKEQFEVIEQSTESCAYMELEIERLQSAEYKQEVLRENIDDAMGNWVDDVFGVCDLDEVKKQMDELKAENEKLNSQKKEEKVKDVKVGEGDVGWEKY